MVDRFTRLPKWLLVSFSIFGPYVSGAILPEGMAIACVLMFISGIAFRAAIARARIDGYESGWGASESVWKEITNQEHTSSPTNCGCNQNLKGETNGKEPTADE